MGIRNDDRLLAPKASNQFLIDFTRPTHGHDPRNWIGSKDMPLAEIYDEYFRRALNGDLKK